MRILIVEDEKHERLYLEKIISQIPCETSLDIRSVGTGIEFVQTAIEWNPDLVFLDIKIPDKNGLEALEKLRRKGFKNHVIVISAYDFFEYAQTSVSLDVSYYLLKPVSKEEIMGIFNKIYEKIKKEEQEDESRQILKEFIIKNKGEAFKAIIEKLIMEECLTSETSKVLTEIGFPPDKRAGLIGVLLLDQIQNRWGNILIREELGKSLPSEIIQIPWKFYLDFMIVPYDLDFTLEQVAMELLSFLKEKSCPANVLYKEEISGIEELAQVAQIMEGKLEDSVIKGVGIFCSLEELDEFGGNVHEEDFVKRRYINKKRKRLLELFKDAIDDQLRLELENFFAESLQKFGLFLTNVFLKDIFLKMLDYCFSLNCPEDKFLDISNKVLSFIFIDKTQALAQKEIIGVLKDIIELRKLSQDKNPALISKVMEYISENLDSVNLENAANYANVSPYYLSRIFHNITGKKFIDVVREIRIETAKKLLSEGLSVKDVALSVGYGNLSYFSFVFKNHVGLSPKEYAKSARYDF